jgi:hypothetical protein
VAIPAGPIGNRQKRRQQTLRSTPPRSSRESLTRRVFSSLLQSPTAFLVYSKSCLSKVASDFRCCSIDAMGKNPPLVLDDTMRLDHSTTARAITWDELFAGGGAAAVRWLARQNAVAAVRCRIAAQKTTMKGGGPRGDSCDLTAAGSLLIPPAGRRTARVLWLGFTQNSYFSRHALPCPIGPVTEPQDALPLYFEHGGINSAEPVVHVGSEVKSGSTNARFASADMISSGE